MTDNYEWNPPLPSCCYACDLREVCFDDEWCPKRNWEEVREDAAD